VTASFVIGAGGEADQEVQPTVSFTAEYTPEADGSDLDNYDGEVGELRIRFASGEEVTPTELSLRGDGMIDVGGFDDPWQDNYDPDSHTIDEIRFDDNEATWDETGGPLVQNQSGAMTSGDSIVVGVQLDYEVDVVWQSQQTDQSATLVSYDGANP